MLMSVSVTRCSFLLAEQDSCGPVAFEILGYSCSFFYSKEHEVPLGVKLILWGPYRKTAALIIALTPGTHPQTGSEGHNGHRAPCCHRCWNAVGIKQPLSDRSLSQHYTGTDSALLVSSTKT